MNYTIRKLTNCDPENNPCVLYQIKLEDGETFVLVTSDLFGGLEACYEVGLIDAATGEGTIILHRDMAYERVSL